MSATAVRPYILADSATMIRRRLKHMLRYPAMTVQRRHLGGHGHG